MGILEGKSAVIMGASHPDSMGAATARLFIEQGAQVIVAARAEDKPETLGELLGVYAVACDITKEADLQRLAQAALDRSGKLDIAINFAGVNVQELVLETTELALRFVSEVHFVGGALFIKNMALAMKDGGSIVTTSSLTAKVPTAGTGAYASTKAAIDHLVRVAACELGGQGVRVNSVVPGFTRSSMTEGYFSVPTLLPAFLKEIPLGRLCTVHDVANAALWLASELSGATTGQHLDLTCGQTMRRTPFDSEMMGSA